MLTETKMGMLKDGVTAPERIWTASTDGKCHVGFDSPSLNYTNEYVRADLAAVQPAQAGQTDEARPTAIEKMAYTAGYIDGNCGCKHRFTGQIGVAIGDEYGPAVEPHPDHRELTVWYGKMPESNGRENWTAILRPKAGDHMSGLLDGFCFARSEYPDRARYEADRMRWIIGELTEKPDILAYDADLHSGYVERPDPRDEVINGLVAALEWQRDQPEAHPFMKLQADAALAAAKAVLK